MVWQESEHPRDEDGKFTYKNGGHSSSDSNILESAAHILYDGVTKKEKNKKEYRNVLLSVLGNAITPAMVLYATTKELEQVAKDSGLTEKLNQKKKEYQSKLNEIWQSEEVNRMKIRGNKSLSGKATDIISNKYGKDAVGMLDIASQKKNLEYSKNAIVLKNIDVFKEKSELYKYKTYMKNKIEKQFKNYNYNIDDIKGYVFEKDSPQVQRIKESKGFKKIIKENKQNILSEKEVFSGRFIQDYNNKKEINIYNAYAGVDFLNQGIDKDGNLRLYMFDTYDFNKNESSLVEAGRKEMLNGTLKGFFSLHEIILNKEELNEIFR